MGHVECVWVPEERQESETRRFALLIPKPRGMLVMPV
jgi:hypothetical protein